MTIKLDIKCAKTNPPEPLGIAVLMDGKPIGGVSIKDFRTIAERLETLMADRKFKPKPPTPVEGDRVALRGTSNVGGTTCRDF